MAAGSFLPPLTTIRVFESAARHVSFKMAAAELNLSPSAVSHSVALLESGLGIRLFHRQTRRILLTDAGRSYFFRVAPAMATIAEASRDIAAWGRSDTLTVASAPAFARA
jgi:LysR family glycine cleavage system transcriptional activator